MFVRQNQQQFRNSNADVQIFYGRGATFGQYSDYQSWNKPVGVSHVYMMLIGSGGNGDGSTAGASGAVTVWYGAAQHVPDSLLIQVPHGDVGFSTSVIYQKDGYNLLTAASGSGAGSIGSAMSPNYFTAVGFFNSVAGSTEASGASTNSFLQPGSAAAETANYGYSSTASVINGFLLLQPIIVAMGGRAGGKGGIGCGGGATSGIGGGPGMVLIASW